MLATVKIDHGHSGENMCGAETIMAIADIRGPSTLANILRRAKSMTHGNGLSAYESLGLGCREAVNKQATAMQVTKEMLPKSKHESLVFELKKHYHRSTKTYNTVKVSIGRLSLPRIE